IDKSTFTRELIRQSGSFGLIIPGAAQMDLSYAVGSTSGRDEDKVARHRIAATSGPVLGVPVLEQGCAAWLECRWLPQGQTE
ncbi:flavin reductase family protein, partial [Acinetobacter baumannii]